MSAESVPPTLTVVAEPLLEIGGAQLLGGLRSGLAWLQANQEQVNDLNVFPVPDGDTGSNMYLTLRAAVEAAQKSRDPDDASSVLAAAAHGSLMGARGNSGVILSQILRGFASGTEGHARLDAAAVAAGLVRAAEVAYKAVMKPTEGTVLTVIRDAAAAARDAASHSDDLRPMFSACVAEAHAAVSRTTGQLAVLREAGVVDAGGYGLAVILEGLARALFDGDAPAPISTHSRGEPELVAPNSPESGARASAHSGLRRGAAAVAEAQEGWGYCTEFLIHGPGLDPEALRTELAGYGDSALVVGDQEVVRVHIHTHEPASLIAAASVQGRLSKLKVEDMSAQHHEVLERAARAERKQLAVVAVCPGDGLRRILSELGADEVVEGGQTMNPSIGDLLTAVRSANADHVLLLPNNGNVILTAQQVDALASDVEVVVIPTRNLPQGISALLAFDPGSDGATNAEQMRAASRRVTAVEITTAVRDSTANGRDIKEGQSLAVVDDEIAEVGGDATEVIEAVLASRDPLPELVTVYHGADVSIEEATEMVARLRGDHQGMEFELHDGGQEHYPYILSLE